MREKKAENKKFLNNTETYEGNSYHAAAYYNVLDGRFTYELDFHEDFEIELVTEGQIEFIIGNNRYLSSAGDILFVNPGQKHTSNQKARENSFFYSILFNKSAFPNYEENSYANHIALYLDRKLQFPGMITKKEFGYSDIRNSLEVIIREYKGRNVGYEAMIQAELIKIMTVIFRNYQSSSVNEDLEANTFYHLYGEKLEKYIAENYQNHISLVDAAEHLNVNKYYLCRILKKHTGMTFTEYLNLYRISQAKFLLEKETCPVTQIASRVGFRNISYFNKIFLKYTNFTPSKFRKRVLEEHV